MVALAVEVEAAVAVAASGVEVAVAASGVEVAVAASGVAVAASGAEVEVEAAVAASGVEVAVPAGVMVPLDLPLLHHPSLTLLQIPLAYRFSQ